MLPKKLTVHGYRSYLDAVIDFEACGGLVAVVGPNGAGKSSIIEMLTTALYYRNSCTTASGAGMDMLINNACDYFSLELEFTAGKSECTVFVKKKRGGNNRELRLTVDGVDQTEKVEVTQRKVASLLRVSYETFMDTVCIGQGTSGQFMLRSVNERRDTFTQLLNVNAYEAYEAEARRRANAVKRAVADLKAKAEYVEGDLESEEAIVAEVASLKKSKSTLEARYAELSRELDALVARNAGARERARQAREVEDARRRLTEAVAKEHREVDALTERVSSLVVPPEVDQATVDRLRARLTEVSTEVGGLRETRSSLSTARDLAGKEAAKLRTRRQRLADLNEGTCETCGAPVTAETKAVHVRELDVALAEEERRLTAVASELESVTKRGNVLCQEGSALQSELQALEAQASRRKEVLAARQSCVDQLRVRKERLADLEADLGRATVTESLTEDLADERPVRSALAEVVRETERVTSRLAVRQRDLEGVRQKARDLEAIKADLAVKLDELGVAERVVAAFSRAGIPQRIIAKHKPRIEQEVNEVVNAISDGQLSLELLTEDTVGKGKSAKTVDTLDIAVHSPDGTRKYATYSGGEKFKVDFAYHVGLARYLTRRAGATMDFLIVDEGLGSQDAEARGRFTETIRKLGKFFKQVMCITHIGEVAEEFDSKLLVEKDPVKGSLVRLT